MTNYNDSNDVNNIDRCTADSEFSIIPNEISQHPTMSSDATMILIYLLSCKPEWVVSPRRVWKTKNISRDKVYRAFSELISFGYMCKIEKKVGNLKREVRYKVAYFKKFLRHPESRDTEPRDAENQDVLIRNIPYKKDLDIKNNNRHSDKDNAKDVVKASPVVVVFSSLNKLNISKELKISISKHYDEQKVELLVKRVQKWKDRTGDAIACNTILNSWDSWGDKVSKEDGAKSNKEWALKKLKIYESINLKPTVGIYRCELHNKEVEFNSSEKGCAKFFSYEDASFKLDITDFMNENLNKT